MVYEDPKLGPKHISLMLAILYFFYRQDCKNPVKVFSSQLREQAKIRSQRIYYYCMKDLKEWGYIKMKPSYIRHEASEVTLRPIGKKG
ncbi:hypothetical protein CK934_23530 [Chitinophaga sp. MD30]|nr:hypothetical protein CK934_23530 [Chitinophaga sp. MD30]